MEVLSFKSRHNPMDKSAVTVINEPVAKLAFSNQGRYTVCVKFVKYNRNLPNFGIVSIRRPNLHDCDIMEIRDYYTQVKISNRKLDEYFNRGHEEGETLVMQIVVAMEQNEVIMNFRIQMLQTVSTEPMGDWTPWFQAAIPLCGRLLFETARENVRISNWEDFENTLERDYRKLPICQICTDMLPLKMLPCGHTACKFCPGKFKDNSYSPRLKCHNCFATYESEELKQLCLRDGACPIDGCQTDVEYMLFPCGCVISHDYQKGEPIYDRRCPYELCNEMVLGCKRVHISYD